MKKMIYVLGTALSLTLVSGVFSKAEAQTEKHVTKRGWSHKKKGAVIGAGAGAVTGAVVSHHHAKGALIGGAVGAGAGYLIGRHKDKKHPQRAYKTKTVRD
ncbi:MAG TPA: glycine zipper domain-containing protein [Flavisolibacter sp.]|nr:glycine zipper domain-containing protein [Flavisolibacter sp.]